MKFTVLGSGGSEGVPSLFCTCSACEHARRNPESRDYRRCTSYLIDDDTLVDFGPDLREQMRLFRVDYAKIRRIINTHCHGDHLNMELIGRRGSPKFALNPPVLDFYGDDMPQRCVGGENGRGFTYASLRSCPIHPGERLTTPDGTMEIFAVRAAHDPGTTPLNYIITRSGKSLLIGNDTGWWSDETWEQIANCGCKLDAAIIDCYGATLNPDVSGAHLGLNTCIKFRDRLIEYGLMTDDTPTFGTHFEHHGVLPHEELLRLMMPHHIIPCYDGLVFEF
ncbi:MAG: MBL fold metallo-hydrolase [Lentisphaeria bacterium]|nr:MBL fold metallo-hydrolase [Lentisphaeria bacterium]